MQKSVFMDIFRLLFGAIDYAIYSMIEWVTQGIFDLSVLRSDVSLVSTVRDKLYVILGIFMLFKLSFSLVSYIVNPDAMTDKEKGANKLVKNTIVMVIILMILPTIFNFLYRAQDVFLPILPRLLLNDTSTQTSVSEKAGENAETMAIMLLQPFYTPYKDPTKDYTAYDGTPEISNLNDFFSTVTDSSGFSILGLNDGATYKYDYKLLLSTIVGLIALGILIGITIDIAIRVFKMLILEMIAPVPVMSYIDPKSQKDGAFHSWVNQLISTFLDLFVKLGIVYLILFFVKELQDDNLFLDYGTAEGSGVNPVRVFYLKAFLILGLLKFAQDAPKFIKSVLGIKEKSAGGAIQAALGAFSGGVMGAVSGAISGRGITGSISGATAGASNGYQAGLSGKQNTGWRAGGDAAIQARLGDPKAKSGIINVIQTSASQFHGKRSASKLNLTQDTLDKAKQNMIGAKETATRSEWAYKEVLAQAPGDTADPATVQAYEQRRQAAYEQWQTDAGAADAAERNYNDAKEAWKGYGQDESFYDKNRNGAVYRVTKSTKSAVREGVDNIENAVSTSVTGESIDARRDRRQQEKADNGGFDPYKRS